MQENPEGSARRLADPAGVEDLLLFRMARVVALGGSIITRWCEGRFGITRREWTVIAVLARQDSLAWAEAARRCEVDGARLSRAVSSLVEKGHVTRTQLRSRQIELSLTASGKTLYEALFPIARGLNEDVLKALSSSEVGQLDAMLAALHARGEAIAKEVDAPKAARREGRGRAED